MAKKLSKTRRIHYRAKQSLFDKLFTFPKLAIYGFVILLVMFVYQISVPSTDVKGASTVSTDANKTYTLAEAQSLAKSDKLKLKYDHFVAVRIWADRNGDASTNGEGCLSKTFSVKVNGVTKTRTQKNCDFAYILVHPDSKDCSVAAFNSTFSNWKLTGIEAIDGTHGIRNKKGLKSIQVCGNGFWGEGFSYNEVSFGLKAK